MKRYFKYYAIIWAILFAVFNVTVFALRLSPIYKSTLGASFWIAWGAVTASLVGQLGCNYVALGADSKEKLFLNLPLIGVSRTAAIATVLIGGACLLIPSCPTWITVIVAALLLGFVAISVIKASAASAAVGEVGANVRAKTAVMKSLTVDAEALLARVTDAQVRAEVKRVYEALRYADPMSCAELSNIEKRIASLISQLVDKIDKNDVSTIKSDCEQLLALINSRNLKCKALK